MIGAPTIATGLPLKALAWGDTGGKTQISFKSPA
jgi:hypothetical protein